MEEKIIEKKKPYSWGPLYETLQEMLKNGDELPDEGLKKGFELFHRLDNAKGRSEVEKVLKEANLTREEQLRLNSPCLDGIIISVQKPHPAAYAILNTCLDTCIFFSECFTVKYVRLACIAGNYRFLKYMIETTGVVNNLEACMEEACKYLHSEIIELLTEYIIKNKPDGYTDVCSIGLLWLTDMWSYESYNCFNLVEMVINAGADINCNDSEPLRNAYENKNISLMKFLLQKGARPIPEVVGYLQGFEVATKLSLL